MELVVTWSAFKFFYPVQFFPKHFVQVKSVSIYLINIFDNFDLKFFISLSLVLSVLWYHIMFLFWCYKSTIIILTEVFLFCCICIYILFDICILLPLGVFSSFGSPLPDAIPACCFLDLCWLMTILVVYFQKSHQVYCT